MESASRGARGFALDFVRPEIYYSLHHHPTVFLLQSLMADAKTVFGPLSRP